MDGTSTSSERSTVGSTHLPLRHAVLEEIRRRIVAGQWAQGERLFEDQIAAELNVSRNPVREALQALASEGFVELEPRRGARVATVSDARATELFEVREVLEGLVASLAAGTVPSTGDGAPVFHRMSTAIVSNPMVDSARMVASVAAPQLRPASRRVGSPIWRCRVGSDRIQTAPSSSKCQRAGWVLCTLGARLANPARCN